MAWRRAVGLLCLAAVLILGGALLRGWLVPASRSDLSPEAYGLRLKWPWAPSAVVTVYFPPAVGAADSDSAWVAVRRSVDAATPLAALRELAAGPAPGSGLAPVLPAGLIIDSVSVDSGAATVRVSGPASDLASVASAMGRTLSGQFPVSSLRVESAGGASVGPLAVSDSVTGGRVTYLWRGLPVPVSASLPDGPDRPSAALRRLLAGPSAPGVDELPAGVSLLSVQVKGDLARVSLALSPDLTTELVAGRWQFAPRAMAVVYTLTDLPGIHRVQFDFPKLPPEGRRNCKTPLGVPLVRPDAEAGRAHT